MTASRDTFVAACAAAAGAFYDVLNGAKSGAGAAAGGGGAPKYDTSIARKGGMVQYASESDLSSLIFWQARANEPLSDPKYAESNAKQAKALGYWIGYRQQHPDEAWTGERNKIKVTAAPPSDKPQLYTREARQSQEPAQPTPTFDDTDDIPF